jgi:hypothetical protein
MLDFSFRKFFEFRNLVVESEEQGGPKSKLSYLEDLIIEHGKRGAVLFADQIKQLVARFKGLDTDQMINAKIDGSPGILFGSDPREQFRGQFFVGINRSITNSKSPKAVHNEAEIEEIITNENLKVVLKDLLNGLRDVFGSSDKIYQGDVLFSNPAQKTRETIQGQQYLTFTPNLLTYAVPVDSKSELFNRINNASVGVILHDKSLGKTDPSNQQILLQSLDKDYSEIIQRSKQTGRVFIETSRYNNVVFDVKNKDFAEISMHVDQVLELASKLSDNFDQDWTSNPLLKKFHVYVAHQVKRDDGGIFELSKQKTMPNFDEMIDEFERATVQEYKSAAKRESVSTWFSDNKKNVSTLLEMFYHVRQISDTVLDILYKLESKIGKSFVKLPDGSYQLSRGEGFVLFHGNNHAKLVDRLDFTRSSKLYSKYNNPDQ